VLDVADLANGRLANQWHTTHFTRGHAHLRVDASLATNCAKAPAERANCPPLPGRSSML